MRLVEKHPGREAATLQFTQENLEKLNAWLTREIEDALSARAAQETAWREDLAAYEGVPKNPVINFPVQNAPNTVITLGAIATDSIYSQALDLMFTVSPPVTARAVQGRATDAVMGLQRLIDWGVKNEWGLELAAEHSVLDDVQLGTGVFYIPFVEERKKTKTHKSTSRHPLIQTVPVEDLLVPGGAMGDVQKTRWAALRFWYTQGELHDRARGEKWWSVDGMLPTGSIGWMRTRREVLGRTSSGTRVSELYEVFRIWIYWDIDGDGYDEDLQVIWDRTSRTLLRVSYNPYDYRPIEIMRYQIRAHLFYGLGVMAMARPYQEETTIVHNQRVLNMLLANARIWKGRETTVPETLTIWPGKVITMADPADLASEAMADVYPSSLQAEQVTISLAERRLGINDLSMPRPSAVMGSRTPGITALSLLQQISKRFTAAFNQMRNGAARSVRQCLYRYQERLLAGDREVEAHLYRILDDDAPAVIALLRDPEFDEAISVELTASSASVNRDADRQNAIMLVQLLGQYYQRTLELVSIAANPQTPPAVRNVAEKIAEAAGKIIERTIRTFDVIRDPSTFILDVEEELDQIQGLSAEGMLGLNNIMGQVLQTAGGAMQPGGAPAAAQGMSGGPAMAAANGGGPAAGAGDANPVPVE